MRIPLWHQGIDCPLILIAMARLNSGPRSEESPMDFKWDDSHGPVQKDSPFLQGTVNLPKYNAFTGHKRMYRTKSKCVPMLTAAMI